MSFFCILLVFKESSGVLWQCYTIYIYICIIIQKGVYEHRHTWPLCLYIKRLRRVLSGVGDIVGVSSFVRPPDLPPAPVRTRSRARPPGTPKCAAAPTICIHICTYLCIYRQIYIYIYRYGLALPFARESK